MSKKQETKQQESQHMIHHEGKDLTFTLDELSDNARASYLRATEIAREIQRLENILSEQKFLANNYVNGVIAELTAEKEDSNESE